jgi:hypothetical protein
MSTTILVSGLIVLVLALIIIVFALIRSQQQNKAQLLLQQTWEYAQETRQQKWKEEHKHIVAQLEMRLAMQEAQSQQKEHAYLKQEEDRKQYYEDQIQSLTRYYEEKIKQLTIDYELALLLHIEDVTLLAQEHEQNNRRQWRPLQLPDADLSGKDLSYCYLGQANLQNAVLVNANLFMADLNGANLANANLSGADLSATNLINADLSGAILTNTNMLVADLKNANLVGANTAQARNLTQEQLTTATLSSSQS